MADESMQVAADDGGSDIISPDSEIPVPIDSLEADGVRPSVGDTVTVRVEGTVKSIRDNCVYVTPDAINDTDLEEILAEHGGQDEDAMMKRMTTQADQSGMPIGGGYG